MGKFIAVLGIGVFSWTVSSSAYAEEQVVRGRIQLGQEDVPEIPPQGYLEARTMEAARNNRTRTPELALFFRPGPNALPVKTRPEPQILRIVGMQFSPKIASCEVDGQVVFQNENRVAANVVINGKSIGAIPGGQSKTHVCRADSKGRMFREVRVQEWTHMRASLYVGEVGIAAKPDEKGRFEVQAPKGPFKLHVVDSAAVRDVHDFEVTTRRVNLGKLALSPPKRRPVKEPETAEDKKPKSTKGS